MSTTAEQVVFMYPCPFCGAAKTVPCFSRDSRGRRKKDLSWPHRARLTQLCDEEFIEGHHELATCANLENHRGQHITADGSLRWSKGAQITYQKLDAIIRDENLNLF